MHKNIGTLENKVWIKEDKTLPFFIEEIFYYLNELDMESKVVEGLSLYIPNNQRNKGIATAKLADFVRQYEDSIIVINAGASRKEYLEEPSEDEMKQIAKRLSKYYRDRGFTDVNDFIGHYDLKPQ